MFLGGGRAAFLEFLRNLTPQIIFLTLSLLAAVKIDFRKPQLDWEGFLNLLPFVSCVLIFFGALLANSTRFLETAVSSNEQLDIEIRRIRAKELGTYDAIVALISATWRLNRGVFAEIALVFFFTYVGLYAASSMAMQGALTALRALST